VLVTLKIYDILGRQVSTLVNQKQSAGNYDVTFNAKDLATGIFFLDNKILFINFNKIIKAKVHLDNNNIKKNKPNYLTENTKHIFEKDFGIRTIQELLGHSSVKTTMIYTHVANMGAGIKSPLDE